MDLRVTHETVIVLDEENALHHVEFEQEVTMADDSVVPGKGIWTTLYNKGEGKWEIVLVHESHFRE